ncbi:MAG: hypothetical protein OEV64_04625 [Desulfobulbaceae bacterium]|nr:hypothetical protein [Desulfobulbaceae bacterium]
MLKRKQGYCISVQGLPVKVDVQQGKMVGNDYSGEGKLEMEHDAM